MCHALTTVPFLVTLTLLKCTYLTPLAYISHIYRLQLGNKDLFHIEAFCARAMACIKSPPPAIA